MQNCSICGLTAVIECPGCGSAACTQPGHAFTVFMEYSGGTPADNIGTKTFYWCGMCATPICNGCSARALNAKGMALMPACPKCAAPLLQIHADNISGINVAQVLLDYIGGNPTYPEHGEYWVAAITVEPRGIKWISSSPHRPLRASEALQFTVQTEGTETSFFYSRYPGEAVLAEAGIAVVQGSKTIPWNASLILLPHEGGVWAANNTPAPLTIKKNAIVRKPAAESPAAWQTISGDYAMPTVPGLQAGLRELNEKGIWDFMFIHGEREQRRGEIHIAGSTDLMYYHLVELYFKKVAWCGFPEYFHHPRFMLAPEPLRLLFSGLYPNIPAANHLFMLSAESGAVNESRFLLSARKCYIAYIKNNPA